MQIKRFINGILPPQLRQWLWTQKVKFGNRRIRELESHLLRRLKEAAQQDISLFERISTKAEWEVFRAERMNALRLSLTNNVTHSEIPDALITGTLERDRYCIDNAVLEGHMDLPVTANIYCPLQATKKTPAIVISHRGGPTLLDHLSPLDS